MKSIYKRVILKISGEALSGGGSEVFDFDIVSQFANQMKKVIEMVVNFFEDKAGICLLQSCPLSELRHLDKQ